MTTPRALTAGEIALARRVFGEAIDYASVTVRDGKFMPLHQRNTGMAPDGHLYMYGCYSADYAAGDLSGKSLFIHEMTHVWQFQNRVLHPIAGFFELLTRYKFNYAAAYKYTLSAGRDLADYNMEQQACIVQDWFVMTHGVRETYRGKCQNDACFADRLALLEQTLARFIADPAYARRDAFPLLPKTNGGRKPPAV